MYVLHVYVWDRFKFHSSGKTVLSPKFATVKEANAYAHQCFKFASRDHLGFYISIDHVRTQLRYSVHKEQT